MVDRAKIELVAVQLECVDWPDMQSDEATEIASEAQKQIRQIVADIRNQVKNADRRGLMLVG